ncbi:helix-turn-helix transcriptional regulator [Chloroflexota bacterium]
MIKEHCPDCNSIYIGDSCPCRLGKKPRKLDCECGKPAKEIYTDRLGEWALCKECLVLELDEFAPLPLPNYHDECQEECLTPARENRIEGKGNPLELSEREEQIAQLADLSDEEIAKQLFISIETVKTHFKNIRKKLGIRSRYEIPYVLARDQGKNSPVDESPLPEIIDQLPISITITIKKRE